MFGIDLKGTKGADMVALKLTTNLMRVLQTLSI